MTLRTKILAGFMAMTLLLVVLAGLLFTLGVKQRQAKEELEATYGELDRLDDLSSTWYHGHALAVQYFTSNDHKTAAKTAEEMHALQRKAWKIYEALLEDFRVSGNAEEFIEIGKQIEAMNRLFDGYVDFHNREAFRKSTIDRISREAAAVWERLRSDYFDLPEYAEQMADPVLVSEKEMTARGQFEKIGYYQSEYLWQYRDEKHLGELATSVEGIQALIRQIDLPMAVQADIVQTFEQYMALIGSAQPHFKASSLQSLMALESKYARKIWIAKHRDLYDSYHAPAFRDTFRQHITYCVDDTTFRKNMDELYFELGGIEKKVMFNLQVDQLMSRDELLRCVAECKAYVSATSLTEAEKDSFTLVLDEYLGYVDGYLSNRTKIESLLEEMVRQRQEQIAAFDKSLLAFLVGEGPSDKAGLDHITAMQKKHVALKSQEFERLRTLANAISALGVVVALITALLLALVLSRYMVKPLVTLRNVASELALGNLDEEVPAGSNDEIGDLSRSFERMRVNLKELYSELESRVEQRTEELATSNEKLKTQITERKRVAAALLEAKEEAEEANRVKSQFLANISHEIRTPLNGILGFSSLLMKGDSTCDEKERKDFLETIHASGSHLVTLIDDILDLSRVEAGRMTVRTVRFSPHEAIAQVVSMLRVEAINQGLSFDYQWSGPAPEQIESDPSRFRQLLTNLVGNAIKFTRTGGVKIVARLVEIESSHQLSLEVSDTGIGIPKEKIETIFEPFVQVDGSTTREFGGTGLGLSICRQIVESLGGTISVRSELGKGSVFTVLLNVGSLDKTAMLEAHSTDGLQNHVSAETIPLDSLASHRLLLVEDGETNRKLISLVLKRAGLDVTTAENGQVAVQLATRETFDLILMDMQMPIMDGYEATRRLRKHGYRAPIIALTAHAMQGDKEKCKEAGCSGYLSKPVDAERLLETVTQEIANTPASRHEKRPTEVSPRHDNTSLVSSLPMDDQEFREIVAEFVERFRTQLDAMHRAWQAENMDELRQLAHWLKGAGGTVGFSVLTEVGRELEEAAKAGQAGQVDNVLERLDMLAERIECPTLETLPTSDSEEEVLS